MPSPANQPTPRPPRFLPQALLIVLPVVLLTVLGLFSLRQDRLLATEEAREHAGRLAQEIADRAMVPLFETDPRNVAPGSAARRPGFEISPALELLWPPAYDPTPLPCPLDASRLHPSSREAWETARHTSATEPNVAAESWDRFLKTEPPPEFAAHALLELAQAETTLGNTNDARGHLRRLISEFPETRGESGIQLSPLALWRSVLLDLPQAKPSQRPALVDIACSNLVHRPTALTPLLLQRTAAIAEALSRSERAANRTGAPTNRAAAATFALGAFEAAWPTLFHAELTRRITTWQRLWQTTELSRRLFAAARANWASRDLVVTNDDGTSRLRPTSAISPVWLSLPPEDPGENVSATLPAGPWLLNRFPPSERKFQCWTENEIVQLLMEARNQTPDFPDYFGASLITAGQTLPSVDGHPLLAERTAANSAQPGVREPKLKAVVYLVDPDGLYARQRVRTRWFMAIVLAAATTALVGLVSAHRTFRRQLQLNTMKSNFVSSVSHELRAPIASVRLLAENLERGRIADPARQQDYYRLIGQECRRLSSLIENVLDFSRIDQGRKQYEFEPTDLPSLLSQTVRLMEPYAAEHQVSLQLVAPPTPDIHPILDGKALQQALVNLLDNAIKHSPPGSSVSVALEFPPAPASTPPTLTVSVTDHGPGIPHSERQRIFEPFYRLGTELRRETAGIGIGLSIVQHIAQAHGGRVRVEGEPGQGSRFILELPVTPAGTPPVSPS